MRDVLDPAKKSANPTPLTGKVFGIKRYLVRGELFNGLPDYLALKAGGIPQRLTKIYKELQVSEGVQEITNTIGKNHLKFKLVQQLMHD